MRALSSLKNNGRFFLCRRIFSTTFSRLELPSQELLPFAADHHFSLPLALLHAVLHPNALLQLSFSLFLTFAGSLTQEQQCLVYRNYAQVIPFGLLMRTSD
jgi:hypothetical protein